MDRCQPWLTGGLAALGLALLTVPARSEPAAAALNVAEREAVLKAAGAVQRQGRWVMCAEDPRSSGAVIDSVRDLNGDGRPEVVVVEDGTFCYGHTGMGYKLLSRQADGKLRVMSGGSGIPQFLSSRGAAGWPDILVGGPGFCFPVERWNGKAYALHRFEYQGKRCKPPR